MKKQYIIPIVRVIDLSFSDIVTSSRGMGEQEDDTGIIGDSDNQ